jgi:stringent starvation protein B
MQSPERPSKQEAFLAFLRGGWTSLHLDARRPGVAVPAGLRSEAHLVLQYGHDLPIPIPDLEVDEEGVRATLSFSKTPQRTFVPWDAVYVVACVDGRGVLYHEDVPDDVSIIAAKPPGDGTVFDDVQEAAEGVGGAEPAPPSGGGNGRISERLLRSVPEDGAPSDSAEDALPAGTVRRRRRPQLRLVK